MEAVRDIARVFISDTFDGAAAEGFVGHDRGERFGVCGLNSGGEFSSGGDWIEAKRVCEDKLFNGDTGLATPGASEAKVLVGEYIVLKPGRGGFVIAHVDQYRKSLHNGRFTIRDRILEVNDG